MKNKKNLLPLNRIARNKRTHGAFFVLVSVAIMLAFPSIGTIVLGMPLLLLGLFVTIVGGK